MRSSFSDNEQEYDSEAGDGSDTEELRTPLDKTFDRIGMGECGFFNISMNGLNRSLARCIPMGITFVMWFW